MTLKRRLAALERGPSEPVTVFATVPARWSASETARAIEVEALAQGYSAPFFTFALHKQDAEGVSLLGSELMVELLNYVAHQGNRVGRYAI